MSAFIAFIPIFLILVLMVVFKQPAMKVMPIGWLITAIIAFSYWLMPLNWIIASTVKGVFIALEIILVVYGALLLYYHTKFSGAIRVITKGIISLSGDKRIQAGIAFLLIAFFEGIIGFGVPGLIVAPLLIAMGFAPMIAAPLVLLFNSAPVSFGAVGIPVWGGIGSALDSPGIIQVLAGQGMQLQTWLRTDITFWTAAFHSIVAVFIPLIGVALLIKWSGGKLNEIKDAIPTLLLAGLSFTIPYFLMAKFIGPEFPSIFGGIIGLIFYIATLRMGIFKPKKIWNFPVLKNKKEENQKEVEEVPVRKFNYFTAIIPYLLISFGLLATRLIGPIKRFTETFLVFEINNLFGTIIDHTFELLHNPGLIFIFAVLISIIGFKLGKKHTLKTAKAAFKSVLPAAVVLSFAVAFSQIMINSGHNLSGMSDMLKTIAQAIALVVGTHYIFLVSFIGIMGTYITGSNTVSNILFSGFQFEMAGIIGVSRTILLAMQNVGGAIGNMISVYNVVIVATVCGLLGREGEIIKKNLLPMFLYGIVIGILGYILIFAIGIELF